jgi:hypothetical protein
MAEIKAFHLEEVEVKKNEEVLDAVTADMCDDVV